MGNIKSVVCEPHDKNLTEFKVGERFDYISDRLYRVGEQFTRAEIPGELAVIMAKTVGYDVDDPKFFGNKTYVCVAASDFESQNHPERRRVFVYKHDFAFWLYIVWLES